MKKSLFIGIGLLLTFSQSVYASEESHTSEEHTSEYMRAVAVVRIREDLDISPVGRLLRWQADYRRRAKHEAQMKAELEKRKAQKKDELEEDYVPFERDLTDKEIQYIQETVEGWIHGAVTRIAYGIETEVRRSKVQKKLSYHKK